MNTKMLFLPVLLIAFHLQAQETLLLKYASSITQEELREHVFTLAADSMEGRYTGSRGADRAADYLVNCFERLDLRKNPLTGNHTQPYPLEKCRWEQLAIEQNGQRYTYPDDFVILDHPLNGKRSYDAVFAGYGLDTERYSDLDGTDVRGKVVIAYAGEPKDNQGNYVISGTGERSKKAYYFNKFLKAKEKGAKGFVLVSDKDGSFRKYSKWAKKENERYRLTLPEDRDTTGFFGLFCNQRTAASLLDASRRKLQDAIDNHDDDSIGEIRFTLDGDRQCDTVVSENVVAYVEGTDLRDEWIVVVAHYDHLGMKKNKVYHGADDNASGVAGVLEIAEAFSLAAGDGIRPRRSVVFLLVSGEEEGLLGSRYYTDHSIQPMEQAVAALNIDMIGRSRDKEKDDQYIGGWSYLSTDLLGIAEKNSRLVAPSLDFRIQYSERRGGGSDHYYFMKAGVPSIFFFSGVHKDYHQTSDIPEKLLYDRMELIVRSVFATAWELANMSDPPGAN